MIMINLSQLTGWKMVWTIFFFNFRALDTTNESQTHKGEL